MTVDKYNFWDNIPAHHPPLTTELLHEAEHLLGVQLPAAFVELLHIRNGGATRGLAYPMTKPTSWAPDHIPLYELFGIVPEADHILQTILLTPYMTQEWGLPEKQVLLCGEGHWWITLDYRQGLVPTVCWLNPDDNEDITVASSFQAFFNGLVPDETFAS